MAENPKDPVKYKRHPFAEERMRSAINLVKGLLTLPGLIEEHRNEFVRLALWKVTEAEGKAKYKTRFQSQGAMAARENVKLQYEHVYPRAKMRNMLLAARPEEIDEIISKAVGCTVTEEEHHRLSAIKNCDGWERYIRAGIVVIDMETGSPLEYGTRLPDDERTNVNPAMTSSSDTYVLVTE